MGHYDTDIRRWVVDGKTDGGQPYHSVQGYLFKPSGAFGYAVKLDYTEVAHRIVNGPEREEVIARVRGFPEYLDPHEAAWMALRRATERGTSEVTITDSQDGFWTLVVPDPPNGWPIMTDGR